jgi:hypothetical protein
MSSKDLGKKIRDIFRWKIRRDLINLAKERRERLRRLDLSRKSRASSSSFFRKVIDEGL